VIVGKRRNAVGGHQESVKGFEIGLPGLAGQEAFHAERTPGFVGQSQAFHVLALRLAERQIVQGFHGVDERVGKKRGLRDIGGHELEVRLKDIAK